MNAPCVNQRGVSLLRLTRCLIVLVALFAALPAAADEPDVGAKPAASRKERLQERNRLWNEAKKLRNDGKLKEAATAAEQMVAIERELFGKVHKEVAFSLDWLADVYEALEDFDAARNARQQRLDVVLELHGQDDWRAIDARLELADVDRMDALEPAEREQLRQVELLERKRASLTNKGKHLQALLAAKKIVDLRRSLFGSEHAGYAKSLNDLGTLYDDLGWRARAEPLYREALEIRKKILGKQHPDYATSLNNLGYLYSSMDDYARAEPFYREALEVKKKVLDEEDPSYVTALNNLGYLYRSMGDFSRSEPLFREALEIRRKVLGEAHPDYAKSLSSLSALYKEMGDDARAKALDREGREVNRKILDRQHERLLREERELRGKANHAQALATLEKRESLLQDMAVRFPEQKTETVERLVDLYKEKAADLMALNKPAESVKAAEAGAETAQGTYGNGHWQTASARMYLDYCRKLAATDAGTRTQMVDLEASAVAAARERRFRDAIKTAEQLKEIEARVLGVDQPYYANSFVLIARWLESVEEHEKALEYLQRALEIRRKAYGVDHPDYVSSLCDLAKLYVSRDMHARAEPLYQEAVEIQKKIHGEEHTDLASTLWNLAKVYDAQDEYDRAEPLYQKALEIKRSSYGGSLVFALSLDELAARHISIGRYAQAVPLCREKLDLLKKTGHDDHRAYAVGLVELAKAYVQLGDYPAAEPLYHQALALYKKLFGDEHAGYRTCLHDLGYLYWKIGDYGRAQPLYEQALQLYGNAEGGKRSSEYASCLNNLALLFSTMGDYARAEPLCRQALDLRREILGPDDPRYADSLLNLGDLYESAGEFARAEPAYREALEIYRKVYGEEHGRFASALNLLARIYLEMADYTRAEQLSRRALEIRKEVLGEDHPEYASSFSNLGSVYRAMGQPARAEPFYRRAMEIKKKVHGERHPDYAASLNNLAVLLLDLGDHAQAELLCQRALAIRKDILGEEHPDYAASLNNLAAIYAEMGDYARAEPLYSQALETWSKIFGDEHPGSASIRADLALLYTGMGDFRRAEPLYRQALEISRRQLELTAGVQSERQQLAMADRMQGYLHCYVSLAQSDGDFDESAYRQTLVWKGAVLRRQRRLRAVADEPELKPVWNDLQSAAARLAKLALSTPDSKTTDMDAWRRQIAELSAEKERLEAELAGRSEAYREANKPVTLEDVRATIPANVAIVDFLEHASSAPIEERKKGPGTWHQRLAAFVIRNSGRVRLIDLGPVTPISEAIDRWRNAIRARQGGPARGERGLAIPNEKSTADDPRATLHRLVWKPLEAHLDDASTVLISPDGATARLPFAALPGKKPGTYLIEDVALAVIPVPQDLPELLRAQRSPSDAPSLLLVGDVDFGAVQDPAAAGEEHALATGVLPAMHFGALPGTSHEIKTIAAALRKAHRDTPLDVLRQADATEEQFTKLAPAHRFVHLATHGYFAPPEVKSALDTSDDARGARSAFGAIASADQLVGLNPGLLSGIALAGANRRDRGADGAGEDGLLTALEASGLDLRANDLVTLSACETGLGKVAGGEGVLGLQRAFQIAGSRTTVTSLWSVDDDATQTLMSCFYENLWTRNMGTLESLREAQLAMLRRYNPSLKKLAAANDGGNRSSEAGRALPPYYWAAFVLSGDWR